MKVTLIDLMTKKEHKFPEDFEKVTIGRVGCGADIEVPDKESLEFDLGEDFKYLPKKISRHHASIHRKDSRILLIDENSTNGIYFKDKRIEGGKLYILKNGHEFSLGEKYKLQIKIKGEVEKKEKEEAKKEAKEEVGEAEIKVVPKRS